MMVSTENPRKKFPVTLSSEMNDCDWLRLVNKPSSVSRETSFWEAQYKVRLTPDSRPGGGTATVVSTGVVGAGPGPAALH